MLFPILSLILPLSADISKVELSLINSGYLIVWEYLSCWKVKKNALVVLFNRKISRKFVVVFK